MRTARSGGAFIGCSNYPECRYTRPFGPPDPEAEASAIFALTVAISTSNSFLIPTHQVNALIMGPAGYRVIDFVKSGGIMTVLFLAVSMVGLNIFF